MEPASTAAEAIREYVDRYLDKLLELIPAAAQGDVDAVHDARAALRRVISVHRGYGGELFEVPRKNLKVASAVVGHLGSVRDPQVALQRLSEPPLPQDVASLPALQQALVDRASVGLNRLRPKQLRRRSRDAAKGLRVESSDFGNDSVVELLRRQWDLCEQLRTDAEAFSPGAARWTHLHLERKALKRLRYMAEALESWAEDSASQLADAARQRQDALGALNDCWQLELWLIDSIRLRGVTEDDVVRLLGAEDGALRGCDEDYRELASAPLPSWDYAGQAS
ncbi:CHAD domain-containing protein [Sinomonas sp. ASV322]|uniref:CHAD domain-containing protein n=1 Tax=Sinomonas sp. ASV322 TaxID=3041920 RepID=UPI0027DE817E|nr:CHAD domain-containing protein [Sinomonas sp. ASV322]MDQ4503235.1 CHAD domain-containing protein [Sinomonas sp. ASV322]